MEKSMSKVNNSRDNTSGRNHFFLCCLLVSIDEQRFQVQMAQVPIFVANLLCWGFCTVSAVART